ncbi:hypothetical protein Acr_10g0007340 [Actinidia rufa]|uniref:Uncharacterized protein n=1 Tax=Actinidia rufa TaxID=165716 RepID=A0A7J0FAY4_9ERIC|nr:hypothetical protein Acr_10g0007340 [Actinidia rufa]
MSTMKMGGSSKQSKSKGSSSQRGKGKEKESTKLEYDATRFTKFDFPDVGMPDLPTISCELLLADDNWDGERTVAMSVTRASLLWAISAGRCIDLPRMMFMSLCSAYESSDVRVSVTFTGFLT